MGKMSSIYTDQLNILVSIYTCHLSIYDSVVRSGKIFN